MYVYLMTYIRSYLFIVFWYEFCSIHVENSFLNSHTDNVKTFRKTFKRREKDEKDII